MSTLATNEPAQDLDTATTAVTLQVETSVASFRVRQFAAGLSREARAAVATRPRFYSMPWLRRRGSVLNADPLAGSEDLEDDLPF